MATEEASAIPVFLGYTQKIVDCVNEMSNTVHSLALGEDGKSAIDRELTDILGACLAISKKIQSAL